LERAEASHGPCFTRLAAIKPPTFSRRENLPDELEPGETYRDFAVRWRLAARFEGESVDRD
jgi:hypothetical protein